MKDLADGSRKKILRRIAALTGFCLGLAAAGIGNCTSAAAESRLEGQTLADGNYAIEVVLSGGSGKASVESPTRLTVEQGECFAQITWSSPNYDYMIVDGETYYNENTQGGNSTFRIPILVFDEEMPVIADTVAMGSPHEIPYTLLFYSDSIGSESSLPKEGAKRVLVMAAFIIIAGGILNYFVNKKKRKDYLGAKR